ncbi:MAG: type IV secretion system protein, partial [Rickettsiales bacterium]
MKNYQFYQPLKIFFLVNFILFFFISQNAFSAATKVNGVERVRTCDANGTFEFEKLYEPVMSNGVSILRVGNEMDFNLRDPICLTEVLANYLVIKATILGVATACGVRKPLPYPNPIDDFKILAMSAYKAPGNPACMGAFAFGSLASVTTALTSLGFPYELAKAEFNRVRVCGSDWLKPNPDEKRMDKLEGSYAEVVKNNISSHLNEYNFGGKEFSDYTNNPDETCYDPSTGQPQKYYLRGLQPGNYNCEKYNPVFRDDSQKNEYKKAYKCCTEKRKKYVCLEKYGGGNAVGVTNQALNVYINLNINSNDVVFCKAGTKCNFRNNQTSVFEAFYRANRRLICAKSASFCPFNFSVGGGTPFPDFEKDGIFKDGKFIPFNPGKDDCKTDPNGNGCKSDIRNNDTSFKSSAGKIKNYCQYYTHCTAVDNSTYSFDYSTLSAYYSRACIDFIGDSQNGKGTGVSLDGTDYISSQNHFSAPIVQCIKETMENVFYNRAGHSRCLDGSYGNKNHICVGDSYMTINGRAFKKGNRVNNKSHFEILQSRLKTVISGVLIISITFFGVKILMMNVDIQNKKEILVYLIKIAIVIYFVNGTAWRDVFFDGLYSGSAEISKIFFKIKPKDQTNEKCNFGALYSSSGNLIPATNVSYPADAKYLMIWDTLDCKIMQYLNFGPGLSSSTIMMLIVAFFFTGGIGIVFFTAILVLAVCLISVVIRAMHIFIASCIAIIIYVFVSPIIIPLLLFERTKSVFDTWLNHLTSFSLQPIILFSYIAIFISLSEYVMFDKAVYKEGRLICEKHCLDENGNALFSSEACKNLRKEMYDPLNSTPACILGFNDFDKNSTFAIFGVGLVGIKALINEDLNVKLILIIKTAVFLFALAQMMDQIPDITSNLIGENIDVKSFNYLEMMKKLNEALKSTQKRLARFTQIQAKGMGKKFLKDGKGGK